MKYTVAILAASMLSIMLSCKKSDNTFTGKVLHGSTNYLDSLTINTSTYSILYQGGIYTYVPSNSSSANYISLNISYNGAHVADATLTSTTTTTALQIIGPNSTFQSILYVGM